MSTKMKSELIGLRAFAGRVDWIGIADEKRGPMTQMPSVHVVPGSGIAGEYHATSGKPSKREVTIIQSEYLSVISSLLGVESVEPAALRRNMAVSGINLAALRKSRFRIGDAVLEGTGDCVPCQRMEETLGTGGYEAMVAHGGITAVVLQEGTISVGDEIRRENETSN